MDSQRVIRSYLVDQRPLHAVRLADLGDQHAVPARRRARRSSRSSWRTPRSPRPWPCSRSRPASWPTPAAARLVPALRGDPGRRDARLRRRRRDPRRPAPVLPGRRDPRPRLHLLLRRGRGVAGGRAEGHRLPSTSSTGSSPAPRSCRSVAMIVGTVGGGLLGQIDLSHPVPRPGRPGPRRVRGRVPDDARHRVHPQDDAPARDRRRDAEGGAGPASRTGGSKPAVRLLLMESFVTLGLLRVGVVRVAAVLPRAVREGTPSGSRD